MTVAPSSPLVVLAKISHYKKVDDLEQAMEVEIKEILNGKESRKKIWIWGDDGKLCRPYVKRFPIGSTWILAVRPDNHIENQYQISICGEYWLKVDGTKVTGRIDSLEEQTKSLDEVKSQFKSKVKELKIEN